MSDAADSEDDAPAGGEAGARGPASRKALVVCGVIAGVMSGLFGVGGGIVMVPLMVVGLGFGQRLAHGTSLAAVLPISIASAATYTVGGYVDWATAGLLVLGAVPGSFFGTRLLEKASQVLLKRMFAALMLLAAVRLAFPIGATGSTALDDAWVAPVLVLCGVAVGILSSLLGVGGGVFVVPLLVLAFSVDSVVARGISLLMVVPVAIVATLRNRRAANADIRAAVWMGLSGVLAAAGAALITPLLDATLGNRLFALLLFAVAVQLALTGVVRLPRRRRSG